MVCRVPICKEILSKRHGKLTHLQDFPEYVILGPLDQQISCDEVLRDVGHQTNFGQNSTPSECCVIGIKSPFHQLPTKQGNSRQICAIVGMFHWPAGRILKFTANIQCCIFLITTCLPQEFNVPCPPHDHHSSQCTSDIFVTSHVHYCSSDHSRVLMEIILTSSSILPLFCPPAWLSVV